MSLTRHIKNKTEIYHQIHDNLDINTANSLVNQSYNLVHKPPENTIFPTVGMSVLYAVREYLFGAEEIKHTVAGNINYTPKFGSLAVDAVCNSMRDNFARTQTNPAKLRNSLRPDLQPTITDVENIVASFPRTIKHLQNAPHHINPTFNLSFLVSGADANFIINKTLFQVVTSAKRKPLTLEKIIQPIGYAMLDNIDEYQLQTISWYLPRQEVTISRKISELMWNTKLYIAPKVAILPRRGYMFDDFGSALFGD